MDRLIVDLATGEISLVQLTDEEIAALPGDAANPPAPPAPTLAQLQAQLAAIQAQINALAGQP